MKDGLYFEEAPIYCKNQHRMFIIDDGKIGSAGVIHLDFHRDNKITKKIKKYLGMGKKNTLSYKKFAKMINEKESL